MAWIRFFSRMKWILSTVFMYSYKSGCHGHMNVYILHMCWLFLSCSFYKRCPQLQSDQKNMKNYNFFLFLFAYFLGGRNLNFKEFCTEICFFRVSFFQSFSRYSKIYIYKIWILGFCSGTWRRIHQQTSKNYQE